MAALVACIPAIFTIIAGIIGMVAGGGYYGNIFYFVPFVWGGCCTFDRGFGWLYPRFVVWFYL